MSEFGSFVPMNKTLLLLDVTRTYQVTDSPFELGGDSAGTPVQDETEKMKFLPYIFSSGCEDTNAQKIYRYVQHTNSMTEIDF